MYCNANVTTLLFSNTHQQPRKKWNTILCSNHVTFESVASVYLKPSFKITAMPSCLPAAACLKYVSSNWYRLSGSSNENTNMQLRKIRLFGKYIWVCYSTAVIPGLVSLANAVFIEELTHSLILTTVSLVQSGYLSLTFPFSANNCCHSLCHNKRNFIAF